jgi:DNA polymerase III epsilon subunit-like protein
MESKVSFIDHHQSVKLKRSIKVLVKRHNSTHKRTEQLKKWTINAEDNEEHVVSLDCEMVGVQINNKTKSALARCSIVSYNRTVLFDEYIKPTLPIVDYRTRWSGIRPKHMATAVSMDTAIPAIKHILTGKILVGHALQEDFSVLGFTHPRNDIRDTSLNKEIRMSAGLPIGSPPSLKKLAHILLDRVIQKGPHDSVQDAVTALDIYRLFEAQWETGISSNSIESTKEWFSDKYWPLEL